MPGRNQRTGETLPKSGAFQFSAKRLQGLPLIIPAALSPVTTAGPGQIVSIQQDENGIIRAVLGHKAYSPDIYTTWTIIGRGIIEEALQSSSTASIAPTPNSFTTNTLIVVLTDIDDICAVKVDPDHIPDVGIATATIDNQGRLSDVAADSDHKAVKGSVFTGKIGMSLDGALTDDEVYFRPYSPIEF